MNFELTGTVGKIFTHLAKDIYDPRRGLVNWGHDDQHILRMLAARRAWWPAIVNSEPELEKASGLVYLNTIEEELDLAILFHDLNRSKEFRGRGEEAENRRKDYARGVMHAYGVPTPIADYVKAIIAASHKKDLPNEEITLRLLRDLDKADMGAIGIYRMAAVACDRGYGVYARPASFDLAAPATEGDENLDSFADDVKFCMDWWTNPKFAIRTRAIREIVAPRFAFMEQFLIQLKREYTELGII